MLPIKKDRVPPLRWKDEKPCNLKIFAQLTRWLARQVRDRKVPRSHVTADATAVINHAALAARAIGRKRSPNTAFDAAEAILAKYNTEVVRHADPSGMTMGVIFRGSSFDRGPNCLDSSFRHVFFVF